MNTLKIKSIKKCKCNQVPVYDIHVPEQHNFVLANGAVVHNCKPYQYLRSAIYEKRFSMYRSNRLFDEFIDIERDLNTGKVDHSPNGHKDVLDAVCGSMFTASKYAEQYAFDYGEDLDMTTQVSASNSYESVTKQISQEFQDELQKMFDPMRRRQDQNTSQDIAAKQSNNQQPQNQINKTEPYMDFGMGKAQTLDIAYLSQGIMVF